MDGVRIRHIRPSDEPSLSEFYRSLSAESRRARFLGCTRGIDPALAHRFCVPQRFGEAGFVAERIGPSGSELLGHLCLTEDGADLEIGLAVADDVQGRGVGTDLLGTAIRWTEQHHVRRLVATAFSDNSRILRLLASCGHEAHTRDCGAGVSAVSICLDNNAQQKRAA